MKPVGASARDVLDFWFGQPPTSTPLKQWFVKDAAFDRSIQQRFGAVIDAALATGLEDWPSPGCSEPEVRLAHIVVLDQFTRNVFRDTPRAFAGDARALALAQALVASGGDLRLSVYQRWFAYLPFEHAEDMAMQAESLRLFEALAAEHPQAADALLWAQKHQAIVARFGRYPHRNLVLGRLTTLEEQAFLQEPGSSF